MTGVTLGEGQKAAKQRVKQQKLAGISKVVGVSKLRTKYEAPEAKRQLCSSYDIFLADDRIIPTLPKLLGKCSYLQSFPLSKCCNPGKATSLTQPWFQSNRVKNAQC